MLVSRIGHIPATVLLLLTSMYNSSAQTMSHEEEAVRNAYAKLSFMCQLVPVSKAAFYGNSPGIDDPRGKSEAALQAAIAQACPTYSLSAFSSGPVSEIANQPMGQLVTVPTPHDQILDAAGVTQKYNYFGNETSWDGVQFTWADSRANGYPYEESLTVAKAIGQKLFVWSDMKTPVIFTSYAAYTVDASFQGQSTGAHHAIFLFGHDADGKKVVSPVDPFSGGILYHIDDRRSYPAAYLLSDQRNVPVVAAWVRSHGMPSASCSVAARTLCCSQGRCGISQADLNRDLAAPLHKAKDGGAQ